jgi:hypothetical protein
MSYGLPTHGELNWDTKLNDSIDYVKNTADTAAATATAANTTAGANATNLAAHTAATTSVHGIANTANLETTSGAQAKADAAAATAVPKSAFTNKGDVLLGTGASAYAGLATSGVNGHTLQVDNTSATGWKVAAPGAGAGVNAQTGTAYTLALTDNGGWVTMSNASASTLTVPPNSSVAFPVGAQIEGAQLGAGQVTITPGSGVTINAVPGLKVGAQYGVFGLKKIATDTWLAYGKLSA